jgi:peptidyl-prolyl cis-trans isomerase B (cyclophilin B)
MLSLLSNTPARCRCHRVLPVGAVLVAALGALSGRAQDATAPAAESGEALRAELRAVRPLFNPDGAIWLRFTLVNASDESVTIPLGYPVAASNGLGLPVQLVLGSGAQRWLSVTYEAEAAREVPPPGPRPLDGDDGLQEIHLASRGAVGAEIDLREYYPPVRYPGNYRIDWRPLDGRLGVVTTEFRVERRKDAILVTDAGKLTFVIDYDGAPRNVENFLGLVRDGFYNGKALHRVVPGFVIQGGCPKGDGTGVRPDGKLVPAELRNIPAEAGTLMMAHKPSDPNSASCQFFIALARLKDLDGQYTVVGQARDAESQRTLQALAQTPTDNHDRPQAPLIIRSINLVDADLDRSRSVEPMHHDSSRSPSLFDVTTRPATTRPAEPAGQTGLSRR